MHVVCCVFIRFSSDRSPDLAGDIADRHDIISKDAQWRVREGILRNRSLPSHRLPKSRISRELSIPAKITNI